MLKTRKIGKSGKSVTAIGLGAMPLSLANRPDEKTAIDVIQTFIDLGGNFIDTANVYCKDDTDVGHNERLIKKALKESDKASQVIIATKGGLRRPKGRWETDASPEWLRLSCERSLHDLNTDSIFLYQLHAPDPRVPLFDSVGELLRLREEGKIQHIGLSNVNTHEILTALSIAPITSVQNRCNILERKSFTNGVIELCGEKDITFIAHSPVGGHFDHGKLAKNRKLLKIGRETGASPYQVALAWLLAKGEHILPIPGASKVSSITSSLQSMDIKLSHTDIRFLD